MAGAGRLAVRGTWGAEMRQRRNSGTGRVQAIALLAAVLWACSPAPGGPDAKATQADVAQADLAADVAVQADAAAPDDSAGDAVTAEVSAGDATALDSSAGDTATAACFVIHNAGIQGSVQFGAVLVGKSAKQELHVKNCGTAELAITQVQLAQAGASGSGEFAVQWSQPLANGRVGPGPISAANPLKIASGGAAALVALYTPADATPTGQKDTAKLALKFADGSEASVELSGWGVAQECPVAVAKTVVGNMVVPQTVIYLNGSASYSPSGAAIKKFLWTLVKQPNGSNQVFVPGPTFPNPTLQANAAGEYVICLDVWDEFGQKSCKPACVELLALPETAVHIELLWDTPADPDQSDSGPAAGADLDLHFADALAAGEDLDCDGVGDPWFDNPKDVFWFNPIAAWGDPAISADGPSLDLDDTDGAGPENLNFQAPKGTLQAPKAYSVGAHYWTDHSYGPSVATVVIYLYGTLAVKLQAKLKPLDLWYVGKLHWPNSASGGSKAPFEVCYQSGYSCPAGKNLMWAAKGDYCVTPCYDDASFSAAIGSASVNCTPGFP